MWNGFVCADPWCMSWEHTVLFVCLCAPVKLHYTSMCPDSYKIYSNIFWFVKNSIWIQIQKQTRIVKNHQLQINNICVSHCNSSKCNVTVSRISLKNDTIKCINTWSGRLRTISTRGRAQKRHYLIPHPCVSLPVCPVWGLNSLTPTHTNPHTDEPADSRADSRWLAHAQLSQQEKSNFNQQPVCVCVCECECGCMCVCMCVCVYSATLWWSGSIVASVPSRLFQDTKQWESQCFIGTLRYTHWPLIQVHGFQPSSSSPAPTVPR